MSLDITQSELAFNRSVKKYFIDTLHTDDGVYIEFDTIYRVPEKVNQWISFHFDGLSQRGSVTTGRVAAYIFTQKDDECLALAALQDTLMNRIFDDSATTGMRSVALCDEDFAPMQGMILTYGDFSTKEKGADGVNYRHINLYFKYGTK